MMEDATRRGDFRRVGGLQGGYVAAAQLPYTLRCVLPPRLPNGLPLAGGTTSPVVVDGLAFCLIPVGRRRGVGHSERLADPERTSPPKSWLSAAATRARPSTRAPRLA
jgi:hypothetical protein